MDIEDTDNILFNANEGCESLNYEDEEIKNFIVKDI